MSAPAQSAAPVPEKPLPVRVKELVLPYLAPYYLTLFAVLGALTTGFVVAILLLVLVVSNFNVLGWME